MSEFRIDVLGRKAPRPRKLKPEVNDRVAAAQGKRSVSGDAKVGHGSGGMNPLRAA